MPPAGSAPPPPEGPPPTARKSGRGLRVLASLAAIAAALAVVPPARRALRPLAPAPTAAQRAQAARVHILRDTWGVPHVFGRTDGDAAFGLAYAHAEDDFRTMQGVLAASRGKLGLLQLSRAALSNDYYAQLIDVEGQVAAQYDKLPQDLRAVLEGYAAGINLYAALHPAEADSRLLPVTGRDIAGGFAHKLPLMFDLPRTLEALGGKTALRAGDALLPPRESAEGSNAHAVLARRSTDGVTRLNVNSHQPWEGPVAWYEAQIHSDEGWNMTGSLFPGAPVILHGHNDALGWAHTVNKPSAVDVYELEMNPQDATQYRFGDRWLPLEETQASLPLDVGLFTLTLHKNVYRSVHGPVFQANGHSYALRYAASDRALSSVLQWYRMNKARSLAEWKDAMRVQGIPMFNTVYADRDNILYVYNALIPLRAPDADPARVQRGQDPALVWSGYLPFDQLPQVENPPAGFVFNTNTTPYRATEGEGNPVPSRFPASAGIERTMNNRGIRSLQLFGGGRPISREDFLRYKFDRTYARTSRMFTALVDPLRAALPGPSSAFPASEDERRALEVLRAWDGVAADESAGAALAVLTWTAADDHEKANKPVSAQAAFREAVAFLLENFHRVEVPLGEVQRLRRGRVDLPLGGGPDVLNAAYAKREGGRLVGTQGDSYILVAEFGSDGVHSSSVIQYGASNRPESPHYADQAPLFLRHELKPALRTLAGIRAHLEREYVPGEEPGAARR